VPILVVDRIAVVMGHAEDNGVVGIEDALGEVDGHDALELLGSELDALVERALRFASLLCWELAVLDPGGLVTGEKDLLQMVEDKALGQVVEGNQGHPLAGDAAALQQKDGLLELLDEEQEAIRDTSGRATHARESDAHLARIGGQRPSDRPRRSARHDPARREVIQVLGRDDILGAGCGRRGTSSGLTRASNAHGVVSWARAGLKSLWRPDDAYVWTEWPSSFSWSACS
jgi:hypothetical protein